MALDTAGLTSALQAILAAGAPTPADAADDWGGAIATFAATGQANTVPVVVPPAAVAAAKDALATQFSVMPGTAAGAAAGVAAAMDLFWQLTTFVGMVLPPVPGGGVALSATLQAIFSVAGGTHASKASDIANAIATHASAVIVTFPPSNPFPVT